MKHPSLWLLACLSVLWLAPTPASADSLREIAPTLMDAVPSQQTYFDFLAPALGDDAGDLADDDKENQSEIAKLEKGIATETNEYKRSAVALDLARRIETRAVYLRHLAVQKYLKDFDLAWTGQVATEPKLDMTAAKNEIYRKANMLRDVVPSLKKTPELAELTWLLASSLARVGNEHASFHFSQMQSRFDTTSFALTARINEADWLFDKGQHADATKLYKDLLGKTKDDSKAYVAYRLGWSHLVSALKNSKPDKEQAENFKLAVAAFKLTVLTQKDKKEKSIFKLRSEAAYDLAWVWALQNQNADATAFFEKNELQPMQAVFREKQATELIRRGEFDKGIAIWREIAAQKPKDRSIPDIKLRICDALLAKGDSKTLRTELESLNALTSDPKNPWYDKWEDSDVLKRAKAIYESLVKNIGLRMFDVAMAEKDGARKKQLLEGTVTELNQRLKMFPKDPQIHVARFVLGIALINLDKLQEGLTQLDEVIKMKPADGTYLVDASYQRVLVLDALDRQQKYPALPEPGKLRKPRELPDLKKRLIAAADEYLTLAPKSEIATPLRYQVASELYVYGYYDDAFKRLEALITNDPKSEQAKSAIEILLPFHGSRKNWEEVLRLSTDFLNNRNIRGKELRDFIKQHRDYAKEQKKD